MDIIPINCDFLVVDPFSDGIDEKDFLEIISCANANRNSTIYIVSQDSSIANNEYFIRSIAENDLSNVTAPKQLLSKVNKKNLNRLPKHMIMSFFDDFTESLNDYSRVADIIDILEDEFDDISGIKADNNCLKVFIDGRYLPAVVRYGRARESWQYQINNQIVLEIVSEASYIPKSFKSDIRTWNRVDSKSGTIVYAASKPVNKEVVSASQYEEKGGFANEDDIRKALASNELSSIEDWSVFNISLPSKNEADEVLRAANVPSIVIEGTDGFYQYPDRESKSSTSYVVPCVFVEKSKIDKFFSLASDIITPIN